KHFGLQDKIDFQIGTLSKAIGVVGGYVAGTKSLIDWLKAQSRPFLFSTSLAPGDTKAITEAVKKLMASTELHDKLWENGNCFKQEINVRVVFIICQQERIEKKCLTMHYLYMKK